MFIDDNDDGDVEPLPLDLRILAKSTSCTVSCFSDIRLVRCTSDGCIVIATVACYRQQQQACIIFLKLQIDLKRRNGFL